jgi:NAD(P)-dependent dehydrogenase (short-subunit alcohol dehydrogenase family)
VAEDFDVALVTGGGTGIGRDVAIGLGRAGYAVAVLARSSEALEETRSLLEAESVPVVACRADVRSAEAVTDAVASVEGRLGPISVVVNGAGTALAIGPLWEVDPCDWWTDVESTVGGAFNVCRAVVPRMIERRRGLIVNVSSYAAVRPAPYLSAYGLAKAGLASMTESLAASLQPYRVRAFTVTPGVVSTPLLRRLQESPAGRRWLPELRDRPSLDPQLFVRLVVTLARGDVDVLNGRFLHAIDDLDDLVARIDEIESEDLYVPRLRRLPA